MSLRYWILPQPSPTAALILLAAPYAGGGSAVFQSWPAGLSGVHVAALRMPGREQLLGEPPLHRLPDLLDAIVPEAASLLDRPYALFGHSLGALVAFHLARELRRRHKLSPALLMVSGCQAPQILRLRRTFDLPEEELMATLSDPHRGAGSAGDMPPGRPSFAESPELVELMLPAIRADLEIAQTYRFQPEPPLPCAIAAFCGTHDEVRPAHMLSWADHTTAGFRLHIVDGDHFFLIHQRQRLLELIRHELSQLP